MEILSWEATPKLVHAKMVMIHHSDETKNCEFTKEITFADYKTVMANTVSETEFYRIDDLAKDGFIFPDGSLKFKFYVQKSKDYQSTRKYQEEITELR